MGIERRLAKCLSDLKNNNGKRVDEFITAGVPSDHITEATVIFEEYVNAFLNRYKRDVTLQKQDIMSPMGLYSSFASQYEFYAREMVESPMLVGITQWQREYVITELRLIIEHVNATGNYMRKWERK